MPTIKPDLQVDASQVTKPNSLPCQCLWQRCNRSFVRSHPAQVFCSEQCRQSAIEFERAQARQEARRRANRKYRPTDRGRAKHRESCKAYRLRKKELAATAQPTSQEAVTETPQPTTAREGDTDRPKHRPAKKSSCRRPGCVSDWISDPRTPHKKFCSLLCDNALRAATTRVERYFKSRGYLGAITSSNRLQVLLAKPGSRAQLRAFESVVLRC